MKIDIRKMIYNISILIIIFMTVCLCCTKIWFFFGGIINKYMFVSDIIIAIVIFCWFNKENGVLCGLSIGVFFAIIIGTIFLSIQVFDLSYDGCAYHEMAIGLLANGWNPVKISAEEFINASNVQLLGKSHSLWIDHYSSGTWTIASVIYAFTGYIESGKAINILTMVAIFGILYFYIGKWKNQKIGFIISFLMVINPITISQMFTNYVDGLLMLYLELGILAWFIIIKNESIVEKKKGFVFLFCSILFCANIKFTALFYIGIYTIVIYCIMLYNAYKNNRLKTVFIKLTSLLAAMVIFSVVIIGYSPYITNWVNEGNPLYPLIGKGKVDIMTENQPAEFLELTNVEKFVVSLFSKVDNINANVDRKTQIKMPFSISFEEIKKCTVDTRISGFGPWFSGIFIISSVLLIVCGYNVIKQKKANIYFTALLITNIVLTLFFTGNWWARYSVYEYFIVLAIFFIIDLKDRNFIKKLLVIVLGCLLLINTNFFMYGNIQAFESSQDIRNTLKNLAEVSKNHEVEINLINNDFSGAQFNLRDYGIEYTLPKDNFSADGIYCSYTYRIK
ncbi:MAG TPA: hypothetical protein DCS73_05755 [Roseburia sp.]|nr:hypothetical protein [Roseburia sp.]